MIAVGYLLKINEKSLVFILVSNDLWFLETFSVLNISSGYIVKYKFRYQILNSQFNIESIFNNLVFTTLVKGNEVNCK